MEREQRSTGMTEERLEIALRAIRSSPELEARELLRDFAASVRGQAMIDFAKALEQRVNAEVAAKRKA